MGDRGKKRGGTQETEGSRGSDDKREKREERCGDGEKRWTRRGTANNKVHTTFEQTSGSFTPSLVTRLPEADNSEAVNLDPREKIARGAVTSTASCPNLHADDTWAASLKGTPLCATDVSLAARTRQKARQQTKKSVGSARPAAGDHGGRDSGLRVVFKRYHLATIPGQEALAHVRALCPDLVYTVLAGDGHTEVARSAPRQGEREQPLGERQVCNA